MFVSSRFWIRSARCDGNVQEEVIDYSNFSSIVTGEGDWVVGGFPLPDGGFWQFQEPNAVVIVQGGYLRVAAVPYTRKHDTIQFLDNAKHMYFSARQFAPPERGTISFSIDIAANVVGGRKGDLYDGYVSFNVLDFTTGGALDFFVGNDTVATVYGKLPFPGVPDVGVAQGPKHFCLFEELREATAPGELHRYEIVYDSAGDQLTYLMDGKEVRRYANVPVKFGPFTLAMGLMSEKDIVPGKGSVSLHGQGVVGKWGKIRVVRRAGN
jgi:hypothetical protein